MGHYDYSKVDDFRDWCREVAATYSQDEAFNLISNRLNHCSERYLTDFAAGLSYIHHPKSLDWIEVNIDRVVSVSHKWAHIAALSGFSWARALKWLNAGRPLSLVALDALMYCTTVGERRNQSPMMRNLNPRLIDTPEPEVVIDRLTAYLTVDSVPRTRMRVEQILEGILKL